MSDWQPEPHELTPDDTVVIKAAAHVEALLPHETVRPTFRVVDHLDDRTKEQMAELFRWVV